LSTKPKILIFIDWYLPAIKAGGPVKSVSNLINLLHEVFDFYIVCSDRDLNDTKPFKNIKYDVFMEQGKAQVLYLKNGEANIYYFKQIILEINPLAIYINGIFSMSFSIAPLLAARRANHPKVIIAPRGMLGAGAMQLKSVKKKGFLLSMNALGKYKHTFWHATSTEESEEIQTNIKGFRGLINISNVPSKAERLSFKSKASQSLKLLFYSRISKKKNLLFIMQIIKQLNVDGKGIQLDIYGPKEDMAYWELCEKELDQNIQYKGLITDENRDQVIASNDLMVFPTLHENFGHVITESLSKGLPIIVSNNTPWKQLAVAKAGFDISLESHIEWEKAILKFYHMEETEIGAWRNGARMHFEKMINLEHVKQQYIQLFS
jgi:glycosyltransferase involved in cell wall biosynthesis